MLREEGELFFTLACVDNDSKVFNCIEEMEADGRAAAARQNGFSHVPNSCAIAYPILSF